MIIHNADRYPTVAAPVQTPALPVPPVPQLHAEASVPEPQAKPPVLQTPTSQPHAEAPAPQLHAEPPVPESEAKRRAVADQIRKVRGAVKRELSRNRTFVHEDRKAADRAENKASFSKNECLTSSFSACEEIYLGV